MLLGSGGVAQTLAPLYFVRKRDVKNAFIGWFYRLFLIGLELLRGVIGKIEVVFIGGCPRYNKKSNFHPKNS